VISYRFNDDGKHVKTTRRVRTTIVRETVNPRVAARKAWDKFGLEKGHPPGPSFDTTSVGENIIFRPSITWRKDGKEGESKKGEEVSLRDQLKDKKVHCRICEGEHFTARCPFKDTMAPVGEDGATGGPSGGLGFDEEEAKGGLGVGGSSYVPPHMRKGAGAGMGERMNGGGKYERDDLATLRVTNVSSLPRKRAEHGDAGLTVCRFPSSRRSRICARYSSALAV
jgi:translation initiation factor 3 subunit G